MPTRDAQSCFAAGRGVINALTHRKGASAAYDEARQARTQVGGAIESKEPRALLFGLPERGSYSRSDRWLAGRQYELLMNTCPPPTNITFTHPRGV